MIKETREQLIKDYTEFCGKHAIVLLKFLDLKSHIESTGIFDVDDESYEFSFSLKKLNEAIVKQEKVCTDPLYKDCNLFYASGCNSCPKFGYKPNEV